LTARDSSGREPGRSRQQRAADGAGDHGVHGQGDLYGKAGRRQGLRLRRALHVLHPAGSLHDRTEANPGVLAVGENRDFGQLPEKVK